MQMFIPYGQQWIDEDDINAVVNVLKSDFLTQGPKVEEFEKAICDYTGAKYCIAVANGTAALHLAVKALDLPEGASGITSPITFCATSNSLIYNGLIPDFADIDFKTGLIDCDKLELSITDKSKVLIPVHYAGQPCDMEAIYKIAEKRGLRIIEDAAHAIGSKYTCGSSVGSCKYSDMAIFSFHPVKTLTTGEGGAITTNSKERFKKLQTFRSHGITKDTSLMEKNPGPWYYEMQELGFNYRITDLQCALGVSQLRKLDKFVQKRRGVVKKYNEAFSDVDWIKPLEEKTGNFSAWHLYVIKIDFGKIGKSRTAVMKELKRKNVGTQVHYIPVHTQPYYRKNYGYKWGDYPVAENYYNKALSLPLYPLMSNEDVEYVVRCIKELNNE